ncbi:MAG: COX15/CtaA family protein [Bdellovibrionota bacterium]
MTQGTKPFHVVAGITSFLTLCLITLGGFVHNTGSSLACPDWPLCFGQILPKMEGGVAIEHSHRLLASLVGVLSIALVVMATRQKTASPKLFKASVLGLLAVILQGVLGGLTVLLKLSPLVSTFHLGLSQVFFAITLYLFINSRPGGYPVLDKTPRPNSKAITILGVVTGLLYLQILVGATVRHTGAGAACGLGHQYSVLCMDAETGGTTWWPSQLQSQFHALHRYFGMVMVFLVVAASVPLMKWGRLNGVKVVRKIASWAHLIVLAQVVLGALSVATNLGTHAVTAHLLFAALLWASLMSLNFLVRRAVP